MKCPSCNKEIAYDSQFCEFCGGKINLAPATAPSVSTSFWLYNKACLFLFISLFIMSASFCVSLNYTAWMLARPFVFWCIIVGGCNFYFVKHKKITKPFGNVCWIQTVIVFLMYLYFCFIFHFPFFILDLFYYYKLNYLPLISFVICFFVYSKKYKVQNVSSSENEVRSIDKGASDIESRCLVPVQWLLFVAAMLICAGNFICFVVAVETGEVNYFQYFSWCIPALSCALFMFSFILSLNKKIGFVNSLIIGLVLALNCYIWGNNVGFTIIVLYIEAVILLIYLLSIIIEIKKGVNYEVS